MIRSFICHTSRSISIHVSMFFRYKIMIYHRIHVSRSNQETKSRFPKNPDTVFIFPVRLGYDSHRISMVRKNPAYYGVPKGRMIHIGISNHIHKIQLFYIFIFHIFFTDWQESHLLKYLIKLSYIIMCQ